MWLFVFASFSVLCPSDHIFYIYYCSWKTLFMCVFLHPFCLICLTAWLSQNWFSYTFLCVCLFIIQPASCISLIAFVADCMPISFFSIHPSLMNSYLHQVGTLQPLSYMCLIALSFTAYRYDWMNHIKMLKITSGSIFTV